MLVFYPLEYISFFSSPLAPVLHGVSPSTSVKAQIWSIRAWGAYVGLHILQLRNEWNDLVRKECIPKGGVEGVKGSRDEDTIKKRKQAIIYQLVADISRLPVILHWYVCFLHITTFGLFLRCILLPTNRSVIGGIYKSDVSLFFHVLPSTRLWLMNASLQALTNILSFISALAALLGGWESTRLPAPSRWEKHICIPVYLSYLSI